MVRKVDTVIVVVLFGVSIVVGLVVSVGVEDKESAAGPDDLFSTSTSAKDRPTNNLTGNNYNTSKILSAKIKLLHVFKKIE